MAVWCLVFFSLFRNELSERGTGVEVTWAATTVGEEEPLELPARGSGKEEVAVEPPARGAGEFFFFG